MKTWTDPHWTSYFYSGSIALIISWALAITLSGCRIGNHETAAPNSDPYSGYYGTAPQAMKLYATYTPQNTSTPQTTSESVSPSQTPEELATFFTDPLAFKVNTSTNTSAFIITPANPNSGLSVTFSATDQSFSLSGSFQPSTLWSDPNCTIEDFLDFNGNLAPLGSTPNPMNAMGTSFTLLGRITMDVRLEKKFLPDLITCSASLQAMYSCYQNVSNCMGSSLSDQQMNLLIVQSLFDPFIQAGAMSASDIPFTTSVAYEVTYQ